MECSAFFTEFGGGRGSFLCGERDACMLESENDWKPVAMRAKMTLVRRCLRNHEVARHFDRPFSILPFLLSRKSAT